MTRPIPIAEARRRIDALIAESARLDQLAARLRDDRLKIKQELAANARTLSRVESARLDVQDCIDLIRDGGDGHADA